MEPQSSPYSAPQPRRGGAQKVLLTLLVILLIAAALIGGYWYGNKTQKKTQTTTQQTSSTSATSNTAVAVHYVESVGYPLYGATNANQFTTKLGVPASLQAVRVSSTIQNQGDTFPMFTDGTFNNELGRWTVGYPTNPQQGGSGSSEISLLALTNAWLNTTGKTDFTNYTFSLGSPLETPAQKQQFLTQLQSTTAACAKDASKGFTTADGNLAVCVTYEYGREGYSPTITLEGYGNIQNQPYILTGHITLYDATYANADETTTLKAISDAKSGKIPQITAQEQQDLIAALKQTTITVKPNPNK